MRRSDGTTPLNRVVSENVLQPRDLLLYWGLTVLGMTAVGFFLFTWFQLPAWGEHPFFMISLFGILSPLLANHLARWWILTSMRKPRPLPAKPGWKVAAVMTFVPGLEPVGLFEHTLKALVALEYPHDTWVLDEGDDDHVKRLCQALGARHFSRQHHPHYQTEAGAFRKASKHGNYNAWLHTVGFERYDIVAAFDPDHVPHRNFLMKVLGYFDDPSIGYVQAPQVYANQQASFIARGAAEESYEFYSSVQMACYGKGFPLIIGCHNTHRISALQACGGFAPHDADDLLLTLRYHSRGWQGVYVPEILARGLAPVDWPSYLNQQRRWTRSVLDLKLRVAPSLAQNLPRTAKTLGVLHGLNYIHKSFLLPLAVILVTLLLVLGTVPDVVTTGTMVSGGLTLAMLHAWERYRQRFYLDPTGERGFHWRAALLQFAKWPYQLAAVADVIVNRQFPYLITPKTIKSPRPIFVLWPHLIAIGMVGLAWSTGLVIHGTLPVAIQFCAGVMLCAMLGLLLTEWSRLPRRIGTWQQLALKRLRSRFRPLRARTP